MEIDLNKIRARVSAGLPTRVRWDVGGTPMDFDFSPERFDLRYVHSADIHGGPVPEEWTGCRVFGMYDYSEGGGASPWIAIRERDGFICGLDIECDGKTVFIFNSSLDRFICAFALFDRHLRTGQALPSAIASQARALDPSVFDESEWRDLAKLVTGS